MFGLGTKESSLAPTRTPAQQAIYDELAERLNCARAQMQGIEVVLQTRKEQIAALEHALRALQQAE